MNQAIAEALFGRTRSRLAWFGVTVCTLVASWALANAIPTLGLLIAFIGATCGVLLTFLIPISCGFKLLGKGWTRRDAIGHGIVCVLAVIVLIVSPAHLSYGPFPGLLSQLPCVCVCVCVCVCGLCLCF